MIGKRYGSLYKEKVVRPLKEIEDDYRAPGHEPGSIRGDGGLRMTRGRNATRNSCDRYRQWPLIVGFAVSMIVFAMDKGQIKMGNEMEGDSDSVVRLSDT